MHTIIVIGLIYLTIRALLRARTERAAAHDMAKRFVPRPVYLVHNEADRALAREAERARLDARWAAREASDAAAKEAYEKEQDRAHAYFMSELTRYDSPQVS